jgi:hypothetical protein
MHDAQVVLDPGWIQVLKATSHWTSVPEVAKEAVACQADRAAQVHNGPQTGQVVPVRCWRIVAQAVGHSILVSGVEADTRWYEMAFRCEHAGQLVRL